MNNIIVRNATFINRGKVHEGDIYIENGRIAQIGGAIDIQANVELDAAEMYILPGIIDDQVHFREPGLTHKAEIFTESRAAVAGGVTSFMEMPNTKPTTTTQERLEEKYKIASRRSLANYSFFMGASNDNLEEVLKTDPEQVCGVKVFMGSSTGNMLVDNPGTLDALFAQCPLLIATHCEDEETVRRNEALYKEKYGDNIPFSCHPEIRSVEACYKSSSLAIELARKHNTRLHILHISTADETRLFSNELPLREKRITAEACVHHLYFNAGDYEELGSRIKCNPAIKGKEHQDAILEAVLDNRIDIIATDHAPHTKDEKSNPYTSAPSGLPLVQHSLDIMMELYYQNKISLERIVEKMCHAPAECFRIADRGYIEEGMWGDLVMVDLNDPHQVSSNKLFYKCGWSPFEGHTFRSKVQATVISGHLAYLDGMFFEEKMGERLTFEAER
jgi:dihydroorotase